MDVVIVRVHEERLPQTAHERAAWLAEELERGWRPVRRWVEYLPVRAGVVRNQPEVCELVDCTGLLKYQVELVRQNRAMCQVVTQMNGPQFTMVRSLSWDEQLRVAGLA